jgi:hypothetical protein
MCTMNFVVLYTENDVENRKKRQSQNDPTRDPLGSFCDVRYVFFIADASPRCAPSWLGEEVNHSVDDKLHGTIAGAEGHALHLIAGKRHTIRTCSRMIGSQTENLWMVHKPCSNSRHLRHFTPEIAYPSFDCINSVHDSELKIMGVSKQPFLECKQRVHRRYSWHVVTLSVRNKLCFRFAADTKHNILAMQQHGN